MHSKSLHNIFERRSDQETAAGLEDLGFSDHPATARPALKGLILELGQAAHHPATENDRLTYPGKFLLYQFP